MKNENTDIKMNPAIARQQMIADALTPNSMDLSNAPNDADHNPHFSLDIPPKNGTIAENNA